MRVSIKSKAGTFAENKDVARDLRITTIGPALSRGQSIILDFTDVTGATQSFVHALISELIRQYGDNLFDKLYFKNCNDAVKEIINIVADYMQES